MDIIFDIDGTLADLTHRRHFIASKPKNWPAFQAHAHKDAVFEPVACLARSLGTLAHRIILCSGRGEQERAVTEAWLEKYQIHHDRLYMRAAGDYRADDIIKEELLDRMLADGFRPAIVFDDRDRVVALWRRRGLICCQVAEGSF
jgi:phosphoglycolate phosphatase-like HAD superfamily hydrolase